MIFEPTVSSTVPDRPQVRHVERSKLGASEGIVNYDWKWNEQREDVPPEFDELFRNTVLTLLSIDRSQNKHHNKKDRALKRQHYYTWIAGICGTIIMIIGAGRLALDSLPVSLLDSLPVTLITLTPVTKFTLIWIITLLGFTTSVCTILAKQETYFERSKGMGIVLEKQHGDLVQFKGKLMKYDPTRDDLYQQFMLLYSEFNAQQVFLKQLEEIGFFHRLEYKNLTDDEKRKAFEHKSAWHHRLSRKMPGKNGSQL